MEPKPPPPLLHPRPLVMAPALSLDEPEPTAPMYLVFVGSAGTACAEVSECLLRTPELAEFSVRFTLRPGYLWTPPPYAAEGVMLPLGAPEGHFLPYREVRMASTACAPPCNLDMILRFPGYWRKG